MHLRRIIVQSFARPEFTTATTACGTRYIFPCNDLAKDNWEQLLDSVIPLFCRAFPPPPFTGTSWFPIELHNPMSLKHTTGTGTYKPLCISEILFQFSMNVNHHTRSEPLSLTQWSLLPNPTSSVRQRTNICPGWTTVAACWR
jgi:hypothetical protein